MAGNVYCVYFLKDPTNPTAQPFYVGKGTGARPESHDIKPDNTRKGKKIKAITKAGGQPVVERVLENLSESDALRIEAAFIKSFGTIDTGGPLLNQVVPSGRSAIPIRSFTTPHGAVEGAQLGMQFLKNAIVDLVRANNKSGVGNADIAKMLGIQGAFRAAQQNRLTHELLGELEKEKRLRQDRITKLWHLA